MTTQSRRSGFTLIELILVMAILLVLASVVAPRFSDFVPSLRVDRTARTLLAWMKKARADAALTGARQRLVFDLEARSWWLESQADPLREPERFEIRTGVWGEEPLPAGVSLGSMDGLESEDGLFRLEFRPDGTVADASIQVSNDRGDLRVVRITGATGRVTIDEGVEEP